MENIIRYTGLKNLSEEEQFTLKSIMKKHFQKVERLIKDRCELVVTVKTQKKTSRKRFAIGLRLEAPGMKFTAKTRDTERGGDWDLTKASHKALNAIYFEVKHRLKTDTQQWKKGGIKKLFRDF